MNEVKLKIEDIMLKTFSQDDVNALYQLINKNRAQIGKWLIWVDKTNSVEDVKNLIEEYSRRREKSEGMNFGIWNQAKLIGYISFASIHEDRKTAGIAYWIDSDYQGKGIITQSCKALIEYAFSELDLSRIEISCAEGNDKSIAIPKRLGFTKEKIIEKSELIRGGRFVDNHFYVLLKQDWKSSIF